MITSSDVLNVAKIKVAQYVSNAHPSRLAILTGFPGASDVARFATSYAHMSGSDDVHVQ